MFTNPQVFWLLVLLPLLLLPELWRARKRKQSLRGLRENQQLSRLLREHQPVKRLPTLLLRLLAFALAICALAKPEWGTESVARFQQSKKLYLAIDLSRSMWAEDVSLNRLESAKLLSRDIIQAHPGQPISLLAFTNQAWAEVPPTADSAALLEQLNHLSPSTALGDGTDLSLPVRLVHQLADSEDAALLVLLSDGEDLSQETLKALENFDLTQIPILSIGIGTPEGSVIADPNLPGKFIRDENDELVLSRLQTSMLEEIATLSGGEYLHQSQQPQILSWVERMLESTNKDPEALFYDELPRSHYALFLSLAALALLLGELLRSSWAQNLQNSPTNTTKTPHRSGNSTLSSTLLLLLSLSALLPEASAQSIELRTQANSPKTESTSHKDHLFPHLNSPQTRFIEALKRSWQQVQDLDYQSALSHSSSALLSPKPELQADAHTHLAHALHQRGLSEFQKSLSEIPENSQPDYSEIPWERIQTDWQDALDHLNQATQLSNNPDLQNQTQTIAQNLAALEELRRQPPPEADSAPSGSSEAEDELSKQNSSNSSSSSNDQSSGPEQEPDPSQPSEDSNKETQNTQQAQQQPEQESPEETPPDNNPEQENPNQEPSASAPEPNPEPEPEANSKESSTSSNPGEQNASPEQAQQSEPERQPQNPNPQSNNSSPSPQTPSSQASAPSAQAQANSQQALEELNQTDSARLHEQLLRGYADEVPNLLGGQNRANSRKKSW